jgi:hypothetical protein
MSELSHPTLALLVRAGKSLRESDLKTMLQAADLWDYSPYKLGVASENRAELIRSRLLGARAAAVGGDPSAHRALLAFATGLLQHAVKDPVHTPPQWFTELRNALLADGYQITWDDDALRSKVLTGQEWLQEPGGVRYSILPTDAAPVPLAPEISALEAELAARGFTSVLNHYRQAVDGFTNHKYESANGDLRTTLEDLVTRLAEDHAGYQRQAQASQGAAAINHMIHSGHLPEDDGGFLLRGLWKLSHTNGSHPGQSDADESRFRMHVITATARFLLRRFNAGD